MENYQREFLISRIRSGYIPVLLDNKQYIIYQPRTTTQLKAQEKYIESYTHAKELELLDDDDIYELLCATGLWSDTKEHELEEVLPGHIEYWKIELYNSLLKSNTRDTIRKYLATAKKEYYNLHNIRHSLDHMTCAGYANYVKNMYVIIYNTRHKNKRVDWERIDVNQVMNSYYSATIDNDTMRMLSRTYPWSGLWSTLKQNGRIFNNPDLTQEQQSLVSWSIMYDKIYESPDCPPEEVMDDDDMLDGWLLITKRKREADKQKQELQNKIGGKMQNADDVFLIAETPSDAQKIELLNDPHISKIKKQRINQIKGASGDILEQQLNDVKMKRAMQIRQAYVNTVKGR